MNAPENAPGNNTSRPFARTTVTAALPYANGPLHIGHLAGAYLPADVYVRYLRAKGQDVLFLCGSDEHGVAITMKARKEGVSPREIIDRYHPIIEQAFKDLGVEFDVYSRTSKPIHHETAQEFFRTFLAHGELLEQTSEQYFDPEANLFLADRYILGTCPKCGNPDAYGDQCEKCGTSLSPTELITPRSALTGAALEMRPTSHWYLPLDQWQQDINDYVEKHADDWKPNVLGQCRSWLADGLQPRSMTRDLDWGIPVPVEIPGSAGKVLYVWFDAPIGYISAAKDWAQNIKGDPDAWKPYWQNDDTRLIHFIGKDNIVFHCIIFPAMLRKHGSFIDADNVPANEFLNLEGQKISTSRNWAVWLHEYLADFDHIKDASARADVMRYVLTATLPETKDNDFTWADFVARNNNELVAVFGNFVNRVLTLLQKQCSGKAPLVSPDADDRKFLAQIAEQAHAIGRSIELFRFREALMELMNLARVGNKYLADMEPWHVIKTDPERAYTILYVGLQFVAALSVAAEPFLPHTAAKLRAMLNLDAQNIKLTWADLLTGELLIAPGHVLGTPSLLFEKLDSSVVHEQNEKLKKNHELAMSLEKKIVSEAVDQYVEFQELLKAQKALFASYVGALEISRGALDSFLNDLSQFTEVALSHTPTAQSLLKLSTLSSQCLASTKNYINALSNENYKGERLEHLMELLDASELEKMSNELVSIINDINHNQDYVLENSMELITDYSPNDPLPSRPKVIEVPYHYIKEILESETRILPVLAKKLSEKENQDPKSSEAEKYKSFVKSYLKMTVGTVIRLLAASSEQYKLLLHNIIGTGSEDQFAPLAEAITYDDFAKLDLRVGVILAAERVKGADKLLKLTVDIGLEVRTIVSGIAQHFTPEELIGRRCTVVANLAPRKLRGIESNGMILTAETPDGRLHWLSPSDTAAAGSIVK